MRTFLRAAVRILPPLLVAAVGLGALAQVVSADQDPSTPVSGLTTHLATPVLSARRVVDELVQPVGEARLADALQPLAASLTDSSCVRVTVNGDEVIDVHGYDTADPRVDA